MLAMTASRHTLAGKRHMLGGRSILDQATKSAGNQQDFFESSQLNVGDSQPVATLQPPGDNVVDCWMLESGASLVRRRRMFEGVRYRCGEGVTSPRRRTAPKPIAKSGKEVVTSPQNTISSTNR